MPEQRHHQEPILSWRRHKSYATASMETNAIYLFELNEKPFYWGTIEISSFRKRYSPAYCHLVEGIFNNGGFLYAASMNSSFNKHELSEIEKQLVNNYGQTTQHCSPVTDKKIELKHCGEIPFCVLKNTKVEQSNKFKPKLTEGRTLKRNNRFYFTISNHGLRLYSNPEERGGTHFTNKELLSVLEAVKEQYEHVAFLLENSRTPPEKRELGIGTLFCDVLNKPREAAPATSRLAAIFCDAGILDSFRITNEPNNPIRLRLITMPESESDLVNLINSIPCQDVALGKAA